MKKFKQLEMPDLSTPAFDSSLFGKKFMFGDWMEVTIIEDNRTIGELIAAHPEKKYIYADVSGGALYHYSEEEKDMQEKVNKEYKDFFAKLGIDMDDYFKHTICVQKEDGTIKDTILPVNLSFIFHISYNGKLTDMNNSITNTWSGISWLNTWLGLGEKQSGCFKAVADVMNEAFCPNNKKKK